uniref:HNH nuclease domain-containing protein n=1 Tax=Chromera velia CCMP2878 TaxID=1169474 RepID=A0A0G4GCJ7_9ALVE|eukprot:Cvel_21252.t1-p1 / transcript=Cvel_21252.t1 / gene=Cvel_21252 / organism=Chromera_velia_CCMP2878 / gene_product=Uncharacterized HNH endonuclease L247, putative / transcript_product=Uncharacterized HNH endonuclease L247, putative / location=Cvel_scaffold1977:7475-8677(+) / protein_length=401 / sequence_SO=supercontig / SO=protein_coding / is_pseudo=false
MWSCRSLVTRLCCDRKWLLSRAPPSRPQFRIGYSLRHFSAFYHLDGGSTLGDGENGCVDGKDGKKDEFVGISSSLFGGVSSGWKVSRDGRIQNSRGVLAGSGGKGHLSKKSGYYGVNINAWKVTRDVHQLVALTFLEKQKEEKEKAFPGQKVEVDHIDGNRQNNSVDNLQWLTRQEHVRKTAASQPHPRPLISSALRLYASNIATGEAQTFPSINSCRAFLDNYSGDKLKVAKLRGSPEGVKIKNWRITIDTEKFRELEGEHFKPLYRVHDEEGRIFLSFLGLAGKLDTIPYIEVSNRGRVRFRNGRISVGIKKVGYLYARGYRVHRLVAEAFHAEQKQLVLIAGAKKSTLQVDHKDGNPLNNNVENLQWVPPDVHATLTWTRIKGRQKISSKNTKPNESS